MQQKSCRPSPEPEASSIQLDCDAKELSTFASTYDVTVAWLVGDSPEQLQTDDPRLQLAARELSKLKPDDLDRLLRLLASMRNEDGTGGGTGE